MPPDDHQITLILNQYHFCRGCNIKLKSECNNLYRYKKNSEVVLCEDCYRVSDAKKQKGYKLVEANVDELMQQLEEQPEQLVQ